MEFFTMFPALIAEKKADVIFSPRFPDRDGGLRSLFPDHVAASLDFHNRTGIYPLMHTVVAKGAAVREQPALAEAIVDLYTRGKEHAYAGGGAVESPLAEVSFAEARKLLGGDPYPFGIKKNRAAIDAFLQYAFEQGLSSKRLTVDEAFLHTT
jgi:4,5-dihydroxyphthalate decarboxylase